MVEFVTAGHLGGYVAGGDPDTQYPDMWAWVVAREGVGGVLDVGCGDGAAMAAFEALGCDVMGIDGVPQADGRIATHDFTIGPFDSTIHQLGFDLVWSCEFVEHVDAAYLDNVMQALTCAPLVLMTHATPGQPGWHHVNCQDSAYWRAAFDRYGYFVDETLTAETRARAHSYYASTGLAFRRRP